ncbi:hypothetical protein EOL96_03855 [Candidatus Saccharibacteria bacterium]|nr:hypothetical protein [Candidatus Saccharibacteria bacterium]
MLKNIVYKFPQTNDGVHFYESLKSLLGELPNLTIESNKLVIAASQPKEALPITIFMQDEVAFPEVHLGTDKALCLKVGNLHINPEQSQQIKSRPITKTLRHDTLGRYYALQKADQTLFRLPMTELCKRLKGHLIRIDHTGINILSTLVSNDNWRSFINKLAQTTHLYRYPTGEAWFFALPATKTEFTQGITEFHTGREPKCELVYDTLSLMPTIQIDIETNLTKTDMERLFPEPYGVSFPELADYFRTVYVDHEWSGLNIRFDLRFNNEEPGGDWETGEWLVTDGGRLQ